MVACPSRRTGPVKSEPEDEQVPLMTMHALAEALSSAQGVILTTHACPDGDGIGSVTAMRAILEARRMKPCVLLPDPVPRRYRFLDPEDRILHARMPAGEWAPLLESSDLILVLDTHQWYMLGCLAEPLRATGLPVLFLDHHPAPPGGLPGVLSDPDAASTGELVYRLAHDVLGWEIPLPAAEAIYVSISSDTNSFKYIRSNETSLVIAADLVRRGVDTNLVYRNLFASNSHGKARLLGYVLSSVEFDADGRLASAKIPLRIIEDLALEQDEMRDCIQHILEIRNVEIAAVLKECHPGEIKISLRSKGACDINEVAAELGGGGHPLASGVDLQGSLDEAWDKLRPPLLRHLASVSLPAGEEHSAGPPSECGRC